MFAGSLQVRATALGAVSLVALTVSGVAQSGAWRTVPVASSPPARTGFSLTPIPSGELLLIGGDAANPTAADYLWDGIAWEPVILNLLRRNDPAIVSYVQNGQPGLLLFGGNGPNGPLTDTWRSPNGLVWFSSFGSSPGVLSNTSMAHDASAGRVVLIGLTPGGSWATWFYDLTGSLSWSPGPTFSASDARVVRDSVRGEVLLFSGGFPLLTVSRLSDDQWTEVSASSQRLALGEVTFDARRGRAVLLQPYQGRDVVEWDGLRLRGSFVPTGVFVPPQRTAISYHPERRETVLVSNYAGSIEIRRWVVDAEPLVIPYGDPCQINTFRIGLRAGDAPVPGTGHRLEIGGVPSSALTISALGFSHTQSGGASLPQPIPSSPGCQLRVDPAVVTVLGQGVPQTQLIAVPNSASLLGERYDAQALQFGAGIADASNGLEVQIGTPLAETELVETFLDEANRDVAVSGDRWVNGVVVAAAIGGDGRHGSFDPTLGVQVAPGVYEWSSDNQAIPASNTLSGEAELVTDGRFYFTDFRVPQGITVRFVGTQPAIVRARGRVDVQGTVQSNGESPPFRVATSGPAFGERVSTFNARGLPPVLEPGQPGTAGGCGGGRGGRGGNECANNGPIVVGGEDLTSGARGEDLRLAAGHAYAAQAVDTGGAGAELTPATGISPNLPSNQLLSFIYLPHVSPGGGGGGFSLAGGAPATPTPPQLTPLIVGTPAAGGVAFALAPYPVPAPPGYSSLDHYAVGGSGGGGGGSHGFSLFGFASSSERWLAGSGGTGGGGAIVLRAGGNATVAASGVLEAKGGDGVWINGDNPNTQSQDTTYGISSPGGGGSGGSVLLQSGDDVFMQGTIDTRGGRGSRLAGIASPLLAVTGEAGSGSPGFVRLERVGSLAFGGSTVPPSGSQNFGFVTDRDDRTGSRSRWLLPPAAALPVYLRYELLVDVNGATILFSDDVSISPVAADDPAGPALVRFQGARANPVNGEPVPGSEGPWRTRVAIGQDSLNGDRAETVRFDLVLNKSAGTVSVRELRIFWR